MGESPLSQAPFLPAKVPHESLLDYSGTLSTVSVARIERQAHAMSTQGLKAKIVVMPKDFSTQDLDGLGVALARQWQVGGDRMLMVIDLKDHKVRVYPGKDLEVHGLTPQLISTDILPQHFIPYMKRGDLTEAILSTLTASQNTVGTRLQQQAAGTGSYRTYTGTPAPHNYAPAPHDSGLGLWPIVGLAAVIGGGGFAFAFKSRKQDNIKLADSFKQRVGPLYEKADQIGAASEYLSTKDHPEMAQRIAQFFNKLTTLEKAVSEVSSMEKRNQVWQVRDGYLKLIRLVSLLEPEAESLRNDVNALTGGVQTVPELPANSAEIEQPSAAQKERVAIPARFQQEMQYRRPDWTYQPAYYQPADSGLSGLIMLGMMLNQMETNRVLNQVEWNQMHNQGGGGWFNNNNNDNNNQPDQQTNFDPGWGDSGGGGGFGDAGGDWGGGGGGGGDFGGGGGDW